MSESQPDEPMNGASARLSVLRRELERYGLEARDSFDRDKRKAGRIKIVTTALSGAVTVLVGIQTASFLEGPRQNAALVLAAAATVISGWDALFDHRRLWIHRGEIRVLLRDLQFRVDLDSAAYAPEEIPDELIARWGEELAALRKYDVDRWLEIRRSVGA